MHELSIALSIVEGAEEELSRQGGGRVLSVHLKLGPLSGVAKEALFFSYDLACAGTCCDGSSLIIEDMPVRIDCPRCGGERGAVSTPWAQCAECGTAGRVVSGNEIEISALEVSA